MNKRIEIYGLISGLIFLISGIAKSLDISAFANLIVQYGFGNLQFFAPFIVLTETLFGLLLGFRICLKRSAFIGSLLIVAFTLIYAYGLVFNGIENCGCFGKITFLNTSPVFTFLRNAVLLYLLVTVWRKAEKAEKAEKINKPVIAVIMTVVCVISFISGYGYRSVNRKPSSERKSMAVMNTRLKEFATFDKDSTYLVFAFTYTCPHCMNSIENLKQYKISGIADKILGLAPTDSVAEQKFREIFQPNFPIRNYPAKQLLHLTKSFPMAYYVRNDTVAARFSGELPCAYVLKGMLQKIK